MYVAIVRLNGREWSEGQEPLALPSFRSGPAVLEAVVARQRLPNLKCSVQGLP